jgi:hypothetical protein
MKAALLLDEDGADGGGNSEMTLMQSRRAQQESPNSCSSHDTLQPATSGNKP